MLRPHLLYYGDDFTGATDTLATAARAGLRSLLLLAAPDSTRLEAMAADDALRGLDCLGIAGVSRSLAPQAMREELAPVAALARRLQPAVLHYKTCSTFDSAPGVGNIGEAVRALAPSMPGEWTAVLGGQPNLGRYCLFGNLFAAAGTGGEVFRIDRHPTMSRHPVTPMLEADLRRHLGAQGLTDIGLVPWTTPPAFLSGCLDALRRDGARTVLWDVAVPADLPRIGEVLWRHAQRAALLAVGPSSVIEALASAMALRAAPEETRVAPARGPVFVLAGSLSPVTAAQVRAARSFDVCRIDAARLVEPDGQYREAMAAELSRRLRAGRHTLACTVAQDSQASTSSHASPSGVSALALARAGGDLLRQVLEGAEVSRMAIAGGDTSSHGMRALDAWGITYAGTLAHGAPLCRLHSDMPALDGMEVLLKGGQMGDEDLFERLVSGT
ncbi:lipoprotein [Pandoraea morbifera]|uniref:Lipoprotein n=2 Tax=Pandoraea morbifera TaxID=2508300 RepID=A0A5E4W4U3_9BURK|nr:lipoprotein [Pandoraea morbifera]